MPQAASTVALTALAQQNSVEPIVLLAVGWGGIGKSWYSSKQVFGIRGTIISCSSSNSSKRADNRGSSGSISLTLDDSDGSLLQTIDFSMAEKSPAIVYMLADGVTQDDLVPLVNGEIAAPIVYNEGERTLTITVETVIEAKEIGFAPTDEFTDLSPEAIGVAWPMVFGHCAHVPCPRVRRQTEGFLNVPIRLTSRIGYVSGGNLIVDNVTHTQSYLSDTNINLDVIYIRDGNLFPQNKQLQIIINTVIFTGHFEDDLFFVKTSNDPAYKQIQFGPRDVKASAEAQVNPLYAWLSNTTHTNDDGSTTKINLAGTWLYLKNPPGTPSQYNWNVVYVVKQEGKFLQFANAPINPLTGLAMAVDNTVTILAAFGCMINGLSINSAFDFDAIIETLTYIASDNTTAQRQGLATAMLNQIKDSTEHFWEAEAETSVRLWGVADPEIYIVSCVQAASVDAVYGHKKIIFPDGRTHRILAPIPTDYYEIQLQSNYPVNGAYATGLLFWKPLHEYYEEGWDGQVYVTATSTVGPNPADIVHYILKTYAPQVDSQGIYSKFKNGGYHSLHDMNFAYLHRKNAIDFAADVAWMAKCGLILDSTIAYMPYLAAEPVAIMTFDETNTKRDSVEMGFTPTTQIKTKVVARWTITNKDRFEPGGFNDIDHQKIYDIVQSLVDNADPRKRDDRVYVYRENVQVFGEKETQVDIFTYFDQTSVKDVINFWGHRMANSWRTVKLTTFLNAVHLIAFDAVELNFEWSTLANLRMLAEVVSASVDPNTNTVTLNLWLPSLAGTEIFNAAAYPG